MGAPAVARSAPARAPQRRAAPPRRRPRRAPAAAPKRPNRALASGSKAAARPARVARPSRTVARPHPMRFAQPVAAGAALLPHAAVGAAGAVRDISDSSLIVRLTRGRSWIAVLGVLLAGIVALNVAILSLNAGAGAAGERIDSLERENSSLRAELAEKLSRVEIESQAAAMGMYRPDGKDVNYLTARKGDAERAAAALGP